MRKTKIICTLGPATDEENVLEQLIQSGMDVARFNFSHGTHEEQKSRLDMVKLHRKRHKKHVACLLDTKGPEIRLGTFENGYIELQEGQSFSLTTKKITGNESCVSISYPDLIKDVRQGSCILIDDGNIELKVEKISQDTIDCTVKHGGTVSNKKGVNVPGVSLSMPYLSKQDISDILFGIKEDFDFIAASFTRTAEDIKKLRAFLKENGGESIKIIAKIENAQGIEHIDSIIEEADGIMVARGDMGVEIPEEEVPVIQKMIIRKVYQAGKIVITATQMLESMMTNPRPTRAESADVANAIYDGTSAIMLSGETAAGRYPLQAFLTMAKIAKRTEEDIDYIYRFHTMPIVKQCGSTDAVCRAACSTAHDLDAKAIIAITKSGFTARMISRFRPACRIVGCALDEKTCRQLNLSWGIHPVLVKEEWEIFLLIDRTINLCRNLDLIRTGEVAVITAGVPIAQTGTTNLIKVEEV